MPKVTFVDYLGESRTVTVRDGSSVMEAARDNMIPGIEAECGGACACATCHVYVDPEWFPIVGRPGEDEGGMLEFTAECRSYSRLACQIQMRPELDGLIVQTPKSQH